MFSKKRHKLFLFAVIAGLCLSTTTGCTSLDKRPVKNEDDDKIKIGFSMDTLLVERWQRDRDIFVAKANELGAEVIVQNANNNSSEQTEQVKYLLKQDIDILVIIPHDADEAAVPVEMAKKAGIKVISYDRLVRNSNVDMYISFDNVKVGRIMAEHLVKKVPSGNYVIINGAKSDNNTSMFNKGYKSVLNEYIDRGDIRIIKEIWAKDWRQEEAFRCIEELLQAGKQIDAVIAGNDLLAEAVIEALAERRLAGRVTVVGHDAELAGCQRVVEGTQLMTVYKPIHDLAQAAAELAIKMARGEQAKANSIIYDGKYNVPYYMLEPIAVTKDNMMDTVIQDGFHRLEDVYRNVPKSQWPVKK